MEPAHKNGLVRSTLLFSTRIDTILDQIIGDQSTQSNDFSRIHALDAYRAGAMLGGVALHAAMAYVYPHIKIWPVPDQHGSFVFTAGVVLTHAFRLQAFFMIAGFFSALVSCRRGRLVFWLHRFRRIVVPLAISCVTIIPLTQALFVSGFEARGYGGHEKLGTYVVEMPLYEGAVIDFFRSGRCLEGFVWFHLWFLWYLLAVTLLWQFLDWSRAQLVNLRIGKAVVGSRSQITDLMSKLISSRFSPLYLSLPTALLLYPMHLWQVDSPVGILPEPDITLYYFFFFLIGIWLYHHRDILPRIANRTWGYLLAALIVSPIVIAFQSVGPHNEEEFRSNLQIPALLTYSLFSWLMVFGSLGACVRYLSRPSRRIRLLADSSYWQYLAHVPLVIMLHQWLATQAIAPIIKFLIVIAISYPLLFLSFAVWHRAIKHRNSNRTELTS